MAPNNAFIFGSGIRMSNGTIDVHNLNVCAVRGPLTRTILQKKNINVSCIYGDPALLLPKFYKPLRLNRLKNMIGIIPHKSNYNKYLNKFNSTSTYFLINPLDDWQNVINYIFSCKAIISSSLHGLICADAYNIPNLWLNEYVLQEGDFKFKDYFASQNRQYIQITHIKQFQDKLLYKNGNHIDLNKLIKVFPFS